MAAKKHTEGHELFIKSVHGSSSFSLATVAFVAESGRFSSSFGRGFSHHGGRSGGRGRGRRPPHCQLCRQTSHYADKCLDLHTFSNRGSSLDANLEQAFHAKCGVYDDCSNWFIDSGASTHMASSSASLDSTMPYTGSDHVTFANGNILNISRLSNASIAKDIDLLDVLVVPKLTKNLLSISKFTADSPVDILFPHDMSQIGHSFVTSLLPRPNVCSPCELSKSRRLPFSNNEKRSSHVLSTDGYLYYAIFIDDFSRFTWFYPLKHKSEFFQVFTAFLSFVQTQFSCKVKAFQSDGDTEFLNQRVKQLLVENGTHHRISCPYTPEQNGRAERKHRHVTETGLAMLFNSNAPASLWVDAFTSAVYIINCLPTKLLNNKSPFELLFNRAPNLCHF
ncbi:retrovirus-related pol polyprotein from transposon TNT 1-94 [Tanacetum coccineum]